MPGRVFQGAGAAPTCQTGGDFPAVMQWLMAPPSSWGGMRVPALVAAATAALLLAGCTVANQDPTPPTGTSGTPGTSGGTTSHGTTPPPTSTPPTSGPGQGFAPQTGHDEASDPAAPGLTVKADLRPCDAGFCVDAVAHNAGPNTYHASSVCVPPWSEEMTSAGSRVEKDEPRAYCAAFGTSPMAPGATLEGNFTWDQRLWDDGTASPAPPGSYEWSITFTAFDGDMGEGVHRLTVSFTVIVGET